MSKEDGRSKIFKSPEGFVFQTRVKALEFMMNGNYPENLLSLMKTISVVKAGSMTDLALLDGRPGRL